MMMNTVIKDRLGAELFIQERTCPTCMFPGAIAMVSPVKGHQDYYVAWCPCSTVFELNDDGLRVLAKRDGEAEPNWWSR